MPTVPGQRAQMAMQYDQQRVTPESLLMTASDMQARGQLTAFPTSYSDPKSPLKLPSYGKRTDKTAKRR